MAQTNPKRTDDGRERWDLYMRSYAKLILAGYQACENDDQNEIGRRFVRNPANEETM